MQFDEVIAEIKGSFFASEQCFERAYIIFKMATFCTLVGHNHPLWAIPPGTDPRYGGYCVPLTHLVALNFVIYTVSKKPDRYE